MKEDSACTSAANSVQENIQPSPLPAPTNAARKCLDSYLSFGFTFAGPKNRPVPQCVMC